MGQTREDTTPQGDVGKCRGWYAICLRPAPGHPGAGGLMKASTVRLGLLASALFVSQVGCTGDVEEGALTADGTETGTTLTSGGTVPLKISLKMVDGNKVKTKNHRYTRATVSR